MRTIRFRDTKIDFQNACVHCLGYASQTHSFERTFFFGRRSLLLRIPAPLCSEHWRSANRQSQAQVWCERIGLAIGALIGLAVSIGLVRYWSATGQGGSFQNVLLAIFVGFSMGFTLWALVHFWLVPYFASAETKAITNSLRITKYDPYRQILELAFSNDTVAELARRANLDRLAEDLSGLQRYRISAHILSHDIRLNTNLQTVVALAHVPDLKQAEELLAPVIEWVMARNLGKDCFYELEAIQVDELP